MIDCVTLFFFYELLRKCSNSVLFAATSVVLVGFSPWFWYQGFQNRPYPLIFLALVLHLEAWRTRDEGTPSDLHLLASAACLTVAILLQEAVVLLVPAGVFALTIYGRGTARQRVLRAFLWGGSIAAVVLSVYVVYARELGITNLHGFFAWSKQYLDTVHSLQIQFPGSLIKSVIGMVGAIAQTQYINEFLALSLSPQTILALYGGLGLVAGLILVGRLLSVQSRRRFQQLLHSNGLFTLSLLSIISWSAFVFAYGAANPHFWLLDLFPALVCVGLLLHDNSPRTRWAFAVGVLVLSAWNCFFNYRIDRSLSRNFPEPLLASIHQHLGSRDAFFVLGTGHWYGGMDYQLLWVCLKNSSANPGVAILDDFVMHEGAHSWQERLQNKIDTVLDSGGRVFVASHIFKPVSYSDLSDSQNPFAEFVQEQYLRLDGRALYAELRQFFELYKLTDSDFSIGQDNYFRLQRK